MITHPKVCSFGCVLFFILRKILYLKYINIFNLLRQKLLQNQKKCSKINVFVIKEVGSVI